MFINAEDREKLEAVKNYNPRELRIIIGFLEGFTCLIMRSNEGRNYG